MSYSIFEDTLADMTFTEVEECAKNNAVVLFPIAVIEEHGPHMCLGTDVYLAYQCCVKIKKGLEKYEIKSAIVPPFYWGINHCTGAFTGSFSSDKETMKNSLVEIMRNLDKWGFHKIFPISVHLDYVHIQAIINAVDEAYNNYGIGSYMAFPDDVLKYYGLNGDESYIIALKSEVNDFVDRDYLEVHAGGVETSWMMLHYPDLVRQEIAKKLTATDITDKDMYIWYNGGEEVRKRIPNGYIGNPSKINYEEAITFEDSMINSYINAITIALKREA